MGRLFEEQRERECARRGSEAARDFYCAYVITRSYIYIGLDQEPSAIPALQWNFLMRLVFFPLWRFTSTGNPNKARISHLVLYIFDLLWCNVRLNACALQRSLCCDQLSARSLNICQSTPTTRQETGSSCTLIRAVSIPIERNHVYSNLTMRARFIRHGAAVKRFQLLHWLISDMLYSRCIVLGYSITRLKK